MLHLVCSFLYKSPRICIQMWGRVWYRGHP